jgi:hypothetical protein
MKTFATDAGSKVAQKFEAALRDEAPISFNGAMHRVVKIEPSYYDHGGQRHPLIVVHLTPIP